MELVVFRSAVHHHHHHKGYHPTDTRTILVSLRKNAAGRQNNMLKVIVFLVLAIAAYVYYAA